jgi:hypothetical protein
MPVTFDVGESYMGIVIGDQKSAKDIHSSRSGGRVIGKCSGTSGNPGIRKEYKVAAIGTFPIPFRTRKGGSQCNCCIVQLFIEINRKTILRTKVFFILVKGKYPLIIAADRKIANAAYIARIFDALINIGIGFVSEIYLVRFCKLKQRVAPTPFTAD